MRIELISTQTITEGLNTKSGVPFQYSGSYICLDQNRIKTGEANNLNATPYKEYDFIAGEWYKFRYYATLVIKNADKTNQQTFTTTNFKDSCLLFLKTANYMEYITKIMGWVGGVLGIILTLKEIFS